jgi:AcrR family transcriptional regulator
MDTVEQLRPRKWPAQERSQRMVELLLQATTRVLVEEGYDAASTNRIARVAGVSVGSLYQYFPNKEALVLALAQQHAHKMVELLGRAAVELGQGPIEEAVAVFVRAMFAVHRVEPELHAALTQQVLHVGLGPFEEIHRTSVELVKAWLGLHRERLVPTDLDSAAWLCVTTVDAVVHAALLERDFRRLADPAIERELCAMLLRYLIGG